MHPRLRRLKRILARGFLASTLTMIVGAGSLAFLWQQGTLKHWAQGKLIELYLNQVQPHLPFQIEEADAESSWHDLLRGRISKISTVIRWGEWRLRLNGPIEITRPSKDVAFYKVRLHAFVTIEPAHPKRLSAEEARSSPMELDLFTQASSNMDQLVEFNASLYARAFSWKFFGAQVQAPRLTVTWKENRADARFELQSLNWKTAENRLANIEGFSAEAKSPVRLKPFEAGPEIQLRVRGKHAEGLWDDLYLDLPLSQLPIDAQIHLEPELSARIKLGAAQFEASKRQLRWKVPSLPLRELIAGVLNATGSGTGPFAFLSHLQGIDVREGRISTEGTASMLPNRKNSLPDIQGVIRLEDLGLQIRKAAFAARGVKAELPFSTKKGVNGVLSAREIYFRKLKAHLAPTSISLDPLGADLLAPQGLTLRAKNSGRDTESTRFPLKIEGIPLELGPINGKIGAQGNEEEPFELSSSLKLNATPIAPVLQALCMPMKHPLPATLQADLENFDVSPNDIDLTGEVIARAFDGTLRLSEMGLFDLQTEVPEIDFNLDFEGIQLQQLGQWSGFGDMRGTLKGYAHDVTFQKWLPTHFDFSIDALPIKHWIEFSPDSMRNLISLFAGDAIDEIPGIAQDTFFGGISHRLGGFDVKYAGFSLFSENGTILLETHDLPDVYRIMKKHYIFWGHRFKMPIESEQYPVIMDETGLARVFSRMMSRVEAIAEKNAPKENGLKENTHAEADQKNSDCLPPAF